MPEVLELRFNCSEASGTQGRGRVLGNKILKKPPII